MSEKIKVSIASEVDRKKIYKIRHDVYAKELGQHKKNSEMLLTDVLDEFNIYFVAKFKGEIAGFISVTPPIRDRYSVDKYLERGELPFEVNDKLYEMRIVTVVEEFRKLPVAILVLRAAYRWIQSKGGRNIMAIGRLEVLGMYQKLGFRPMNKIIQSGEVKFDLLYGNVEELHKHYEERYGEFFNKLIERCHWDLNFPFFKPVECYHGGQFFKAIGEKFDYLHRKNEVINADVLDAWFPPSPKVINELESHLPWLVKTSPPTGCAGMIEVIAKKRGVDPENILPGAGSSDLIFLAFREWLNKNSKVLILDPTYGEYQHVLLNVVQCQVDHLTLCKDQTYQVDLERLLTMSKNKYDMIVLVNPNSPTGQTIPKKQLEKVLEKISKSTRIWIDETYVEYAGKNQSFEKFATQTENVIICKSMSKVYALSGIRSAYLCASPIQLETLRLLTPPWAVSLPAQLSAVIALQDEEYYLQKYSETHQLRDEMMGKLSVLPNVEITPTMTNFILFHLEKNGMRADDLVKRCRERNLYIRNVGNMGSQFGDYTIRIAVKDRETNYKIIDIITNVLNAKFANSPSIELNDEVVSSVLS